MDLGESVLPLKALNDDIALFSAIHQLLLKHVGQNAREFQGEAWVKVCEARDVAIARGRTQEKDLEAFCKPHVRKAVAHVWSENALAGSKSGVFGTHLDPQLKPIPSTATNRPDHFDQDALWAAAFEKANDTMKRNLEWWKKRRFKNESFQTIAHEHPLRVAESTVRGGIARAERFLRKTQDGLAKAPCGSGEISFPEVQAAYLANDATLLAEALKSHQPIGDDAVLLNYQGMLHLWNGNHDLAKFSFESALIFGDSPNLRCIITNNIGLLLEESADLEGAQRWYERARGLNPKAPTPLLNLLGLVCMRATPDFTLTERAKLLHYIDCISQLLSSRSLAPKERTYLLDRLRQNPVFQPARRTTSWKRVRAWLNREPSQEKETTSIAACVQNRES